MSYHPLYTYGYAGGSIQDLEGYAAAGALILDIRTEPWSRRPEFRREVLAPALGSAYRHCLNLGNRNYRTGGTIQIIGLPQGLALLADQLVLRPVVLLCGCRDAASCHRTYVAEALRGMLPAVGTAVDLLPGQGLGGQVEVRPGRIKALSLWQPWASLVALGAKRIETRNWRTPYTGPIAIHATKTWVEGTASLALQEPYRGALGAAGVKFLRDLPLGAVVAVATLAGCVQTDVLLRDRSYGVTPQEEAFGDYGEGRWGWLLRDIRRLPEPIPAKGAQGLWEWEPPEGGR